MSKTVIVFNNEDIKVSSDQLRRVDRDTTAMCFLAMGAKEVRIEGEGLRQAYIFLKKDVDELDKMLIHSPEKICPPWPAVVAAMAHWKDTYALLKSMQKSNG